MSMLNKYGEKRDFQKSPEPKPVFSKIEGPLVFVVQKHSARQLHYDLRLESGGVLKSWSIPKGPSLNPSEKRLAVMVEDHPIDYRSFEGIIPKGEYGAGQVIVWDEGTYFPEDETKTPVDDRSNSEGIMKNGLEEGKVAFTLRGHKLKGSWALVKIRGAGNNWLLIKHKDNFAQLDKDILEEEESIISGLTINDLKKGLTRGTGHSSNLNVSEIEGARKAGFPPSMKPMLAYPGSFPPPGKDWLFEPKLDGFRTMGLIENGKIKLLSRNGIDVTQNYADLLPALVKQPVTTAIVDGEIIALDDNDRPCFQCLQQYLKATRDKKGKEIPILYYIFDVLYLNGYELNDVQLHNRKDLLNQFIEESSNVRTVAFFDKDGPTIYKSSLEKGFEGILAKLKNSIYEPGKRSHDWLKIKPLLTDDFIIGGYTQGLGNRAKSFGALLLGYYDENGALVYVGHVGSGFNDEALFDLLNKMVSIRRDKCPFNVVPPQSDSVTWVKPQLVVEVKYLQWTQDGLLRAPVFLRLREDKSADEVHSFDVLDSRNDLYMANNQLNSKAENVIGQLLNADSDFTLVTGDFKLPITNLNKSIWPPVNGARAITKRDLLLYLAKISSYILPHLKERPLTLKRYPEGIHGEFFYQRHWDEHRPDFVEVVKLTMENEGIREFLMCNNLATLLWLGQIGSIEFHSWFSRINLLSEGKQEIIDKKEIDDPTNFPDFIVFDLDPYIYSGLESKGAEPELNRRAFSMTCKVALWLKQILSSLSLEAFVKTSGRTGLHIYVPVNRQLDYRSIRSAAQTISRFALEQHPDEVSIDWSVEKRAGKVFIDYNQNVRSKTLGAIYSPRASVEATVSTPLNWDELDKIYPTDFTVLTVPERVAHIGDIWANILEAKSDLNKLLKI
jgi:bifunctional non-homologous end joining protein LigD